ncbi:DUF4188 domain-containing protein [Luteipulveratus mongoliensis]|uniref:Uncharacterized protein n=1 Tax=Luteipulveratus mongoliensis TaxID=571913 RepID=A0A0K1JI05_9MICO|nr:DUF4188 domain-containing protein [Luteipulveratus mongoliensis]AKU16341.1 hypothetical protein VV02_11505 [Luteipulveratus mongoliensis]
MVERQTHSHEGEIAVFLLGMTINRPWRPDHWLPAFRAMPAMLGELYTNKAQSEGGEEEWLGFMGARSLFGARGPTVIQYWRSTDDIYRYAGMTDRVHRPAWLEFYRQAKAHPDSVGVWHETYAVPADGHESIYYATPSMGLGAVTSLVPVRRRGDTARERLGSEVRATTA